MPASPVVTTIPHYANLSGSLIAIVVKFNESVIHITTIFHYSCSLISDVFMQDTFNVSNGIDGSTISYTVIYSDSISGSICSLIIIPATLCGDRVCSHMFEVSLSSCSHDSNINVTTFATNILGDGPRSEPVTVGTVMTNNNNCRKKFIR